jgi:hypothetical protein
MIVVTLIEVVMVARGYRVKYGMTWQAKRRALKLIYGNWAEAYERLPIKAKNPEMHFESPVIVAFSVTHHPSS